MRNLNSIIKKDKLILDSNGIYVNPYFKDMSHGDDINISKNAWSNIYDFNLEKLKQKSEDFKESKLYDAVKSLEKSYLFSNKTVYLEIGCGPAYIGDYILEHYKGYFVGIDFNYEMLVTLKRYFDEKGYINYILIFDDINNMPLKDNCVDFIYGGGVIEHFKNTNHILKESYRVLKKGGVSFNTVPAFNLWWVFRFFNNIPDLMFLRSILEFFHIRLLKGKILEKYYGYELSFTPYKLIMLHKKNRFKSINVAPFPFYPSKNKLKSNLLRKIYYILQKNLLTSAFYQVYAQK